MSIVWSLQVLLSKIGLEEAKLASAYLQSKFGDQFQEYIGTLRNIGTTLCIVSIALFISGLYYQSTVLIIISGFMVAIFLVVLYIYELPFIILLGITSGLALSISKTIDTINQEVKLKVNPSDIINGMINAGIGTALLPLTAGIAVAQTSYNQAMVFCKSSFVAFRGLILVVLVIFLSFVILQPYQVDPVRTWSVRLGLVVLTLMFYHWKLKAGKSLQYGAIVFVSGFVLWNLVAIFIPKPIQILEANFRNYNERAATCMEDPNQPGSECLPFGENNSEAPQVKGPWQRYLPAYTGKPDEKRLYLDTPCVRQGKHAYVVVQAEREVFFQGTTPGVLHSILDLIPGEENPLESLQTIGIRVTGKTLPTDWKFRVYAPVSSKPTGVNFELGPDSECLH